MQAEIYWVEAPEGRRIGVMPRPRAGDWLEDEIRSLHQQGLTALVCLLTDPELTELGLQDLEVVCAACSLTFLRFPIVDRSVPQDRAAAIAFVEALAAQTRQGEVLGIHCRMGLGRSAMIAAAVLAALGLTPDESFHRIAAARGLSVPDTREQRKWVEGLPGPKTAAGSSGALP